MADDSTIPNPDQRTLLKERDVALRMHQVQFERANRLEAQVDRVQALADDLHEEAQAVTTETHVALARKATLMRAVRLTRAALDGDSQ